MSSDELEFLGIITFPIAEAASRTPISNLIDVAGALANKVVLVTGNKGFEFFRDDERVHTVGGWYKAGGNPIRRTIAHLSMQLMFAVNLARESRNIRTWIFFMGGDLLVIPMIVAKILRRRVFLVSAASSHLICRYQFDLIRSTEQDDEYQSKLRRHPVSYSRATELLSGFAYALSTRVILYSRNLLLEWNLEKYSKKVRYAHEHFITNDKYGISRAYQDRKSIVGFVGRLSEEKGARNFAKSIPLMLDQIQDLEFLIAGDGNLQTEIKEFLTKTGLRGKVRLTGWVAHDELPAYLNELKLLVLPSYTEGLPNIMLEAMACGTPVLAVSVGSIPDVIEDKKNGFALKSNSPECIAGSATEALAYPQIDRLIAEARHLVESEYSFDKAIERWKSALDDE